MFNLSNFETINFTHRVMGTISEIYNKKSQILLGRPLLSPAHENNENIPEQLNMYLMNVSREIYCEGRPIEFDTSTRQIGDVTFINMSDGTITDEDGNVLFQCFNDYLLSNVEPTLLFIESFHTRT